MRRTNVLIDDQNAAATELGYVLTFLMWLSFMSFFSVVTWQMQDERGDVWREQAMEENLDSVAAAIERAEMASRLDGNGTYAEPVDLLLSTAVNMEFRMVLTDDHLLMQDRSGEMSATRSISGTGTANHSGDVELAGIKQVWVVSQAGNITIRTSQPGF